MGCTDRLRRLPYKQVNLFHEYVADETDFSLGKMFLSMLVFALLLVAFIVEFSFYASNPKQVVEVLLETPTVQNTQGYVCQCQNVLIPYDDFIFVNISSITIFCNESYYNRTYSNGLLIYQLCSSSFEKFAKVIITEDFISTNLVDEKTIRRKLDTIFQTALVSQASVFSLARSVSQVFLISLYQAGAMNQSQFESALLASGAYVPLDPTSFLFAVVQQTQPRMTNLYSVDMGQHFTQCNPMNCQNIKNESLWETFGNSISFVGGLSSIGISVAAVVYGVFLVILAGFFPDSPVLHSARRVTLARKTMHMPNEGEEVGMGEAKGEAVKD